MLRYGVCIVVAVMTIIIGCGEASSSGVPTHEATDRLVPTKRTLPTPSLSETSTSSVELDFKLPEGDRPGWLRNSDNRLGHVVIAFSPDGRLLAASYGKGPILFWDMATGQQVDILKYPPSFYQDTDVTVLKFSPDGNLLAVVAAGGRLDIWDMTTGQQVSTLKYPPDRYDTGVLDFEFSLDATLLAALYGQYGGRLDMWDVAAGTFQSLTSDALRSYQQVEFSPDGSRLAVGPSFDPPSTDYQVEIWGPTGDTWTRQRILVDAKPGFAFSPDGTLLATLSGVDYTASITNPGPPVLWDVATGARRELAVDGFPLSLAYSPDGKTLAISTAPKAVGISGEAGTFLVDVRTGEIRHFIKSLDGMHPAVTFNVDGSLLVALYSSANQIILWDVQTGNQIHALDAPADGLSSFPMLSPDGRLLAAVSYDGQEVILWNMPQ